MMRGSRLPVLLRIVFLLFVGLTLRAPWASAQATLPIKIGYQPTANLLLYVARDLKLFEKAGLAPTYVRFVAGPPMIAAAESKSIDVTGVGIVPFLRGLSQGVDWVMIGVGHEGAYSEGLVARKDSGIETPTDLKGKNIGFFKGTTAHYGVMMTLRQYGIRLDEVKLLDMPPAEQLAAMARKELDAAMVWEPWIQRMVHEANAKILVIEGDIGIYTTMEVYSARRDWLRDNREAAVRFLRALLLAYDVLQKDSRVGISLGAKEMGINEGWVETIYQDVPPPKIYEWANPRYNYSIVRGSALHRRLGYVATFLFDEKVIPRPVDVREALDASVIAEALRTWKQGQ